MRLSSETISKSITFTASLSMLLCALPGYRIFFTLLYFASYFTTLFSLTCLLLFYALAAS
jgi:hypothetical protein